MSSNHCNSNILYILCGCLHMLVIVVFAAVHDDIPQCGLTAIYKNRQSVLESPNYPNDYPQNSCWDYVVRSPYRCPTKFHIQFLEFSLELSENCSHDYLAIGVNNDGDDMEILCGQIIGIKKYHTLDGILRLRFYADDSPWTTDKGFKILVTRLACEKADAVREIYNDTEEVVLPPSYLRSSYVNGANLFQNFSLQEQYQDLPSKASSLNPGIAYYPQLPTASNFQPSQALCPQNWITGQLNNVPQIIEQWQSRALVKSANEPLAKHLNGIGVIPQAIPACCLSAFKQERFYLSSPGFPRTVITSLLPSERRDCQFQLEKFSQKVCRLRIEFKFFDFGQPYAGNAYGQENIAGSSENNQNVCAEDFLEIDGLRYCGCRTDYFARLNWDLNQKIIRMRMGFSGLPSNGFLLYIIQEECAGAGALPPTSNGIESVLNTGVSSIGSSDTNIQQPNALPVKLNPFYNVQQRPLYLPSQPVYQPAVINSNNNNLQPLIPYYTGPYVYNPYMIRQSWPLNRVQPQLQYPQYRSYRNAKYKSDEKLELPLTVVETNSTRKEFYYSDNDKLQAKQWEAQSRSSDAQYDFNSDAKNQKIVLRDGNRCVFGTSDIFKLLIDPLWLRKPTCYAPQGNFLGNVVG